MEIEEVIEKFRYGTPLNYQTVIRKLQHDKITDVAITRKEYIDTILNYIDKLQKELKDSINARFELQRRIDKTQKENEVLKEVHKEFATLCRELKTDDTLMSAKSVMEKVVSKDKIRNKIKELEKTKNYIISMYAIGILEELLGDDE